MIWKPIPGFEGFYEVSDTGLVKSVERVIETENKRYRKSGKQTLREKILKLNKARGLVLRKDKASFYFKVAQLVLLAHKGPPAANEEDNPRHLDNNPDNNTIENLAWEPKDPRIRLASLRQQANNRRKYSNRRFI